MTNNDLVGKKKKKKKKPVKQQYPLKHAFLHVHTVENGRIEIPKGITDIISRPPLFGNFVWGNANEAQLKDAAAAMVAAAKPFPCYFFFHCDGDYRKGETPWLANSEQKKRFFDHMRMWAETDIAGFIIDLEDEGRIVKRVPSDPPRDPDPGVIVTPWWPAGSYATEFAREMVSACSPKPVEAYTLAWTAENAYGYNDTLTPPIFPAPGMNAFCRSLRDGYKLLLGDTYSWGVGTDIENVVRKRYVGTGTYQFGNPELVLGTWLRAARPEDSANRLGLVTKIRQTWKNGNWFCYADLGMITSQKSLIEAVLK